MISFQELTALPLICLPLLFHLGDGVCFLSHTGVVCSRQPTYLDSAWYLV